MFRTLLLPMRLGRCFGKDLLDAGRKIVQVTEKVNELPGLLRAGNGGKASLGLTAPRCGAI